MSLHVLTQPPEDWGELLQDLDPHPSFLQTAAWARVKAPWGWQARYLCWHSRGGPQAAALVLVRTLGPGVGMAYLPHGPVVRAGAEALWPQVLDDLRALARREAWLYLKADLNLPLAFGEPGPEERRHPLGERVQAMLRAGGWRPSTEWVQFPNTLWLDLTPDETTLLARMKQKTRYNIRLAARKGVQVHTVEPEGFPRLYEMYAVTARRDGFPIRSRAYYLHLWRTLSEAGMLTAFEARVEGEPVAGLVLVHFAKTAWYVHGMSLRKHREKMPNYALQWAAIRRAKALGCTRYDFWGAPFSFSPNDPMWGVYRFKKGFGGQVVRTLGPWDWPPKPWRYRVYMGLRRLWLRLRRRRR